MAKAAGNGKAIRSPKKGGLVNPDEVIPSRKKAKAIKAKGAEQAFNGLSRGYKNLKKADGIGDILTLDNFRNAKDLVSGLWKMAFNHPEWYDRGSSIGSKLQPLTINFNQNKSATLLSMGGKSFDWIQSSSQVTPALVMTIPEALTLWDESDSNASVRNAIIYDLSKLVSRSGRIPSYTDDQLLEYIHDTRTVYAMLATAVKMFELSFMSDPLDTLKPEYFFKSTGWSEISTESLSFLSEVGPVRDTLQSLLVRWGDIAQGDCTLFDRTMWLFSTIFVDAKSPKATYIHHIPYRPYFLNLSAETAADRVDYIYSGPGSKLVPLAFGTGTPNFQITVNATSTGSVFEFTTWDNMLRTISNAINKWCVKYANTQILADMSRVSGHSNHINTLVDRVMNLTPVPVVVYDDYHMKQIMNAKSLCFSDFTSNTTAPSIPQYVVQDTGATSISVTYELASSASDSGWFSHIAPVIKEFGVINAPEDVEVNNAPYDTSTALIQTSITRLHPMLDAIQFDSDRLIVTTATVGSEVPLFFTVIGYNPGIGTAGANYKIRTYTTVHFGVSAAAMGEWPSITQIDYHPCVLMLDRSPSDPGAFYVRNMLFDLQVYAISERSVISAFNAKAMYSMMLLTEEPEAYIPVTN